MPPLTPDALLLKWNVIEPAGLLSFIVRYGMLRFAPPLIAVEVVILLAMHAAFTVAAIVPAILVPLLVGALWAVYTWAVCTKRWKASPRP